MLSHKSSSEVPYLFLGVLVQVRFVLELLLQRYDVCLVSLVDSDVRVLKLHIVQVGWIKPLAQLQQVVSIEEELRIALLHLSEKQSESTFVVLAD